ncbi:MAG: squalene/phytoene synthase family protein [Micrococcus sp.]|nr:squalene/phytoene synthase family protein [Micrococcus sp.]
MNTGNAETAVAAGAITDTQRAELTHYTQTAFAAAQRVITAYSTSFSWACRTLPAGTRQDISAIYAMVRVADEVVDGTAHAAGLPDDAARARLDAYEAATQEAMATGFSTDLVLHAFADVCRRHDITPALTRPFFASMRADLQVTDHDAASLQDYIYGSAEVVGLMCLQVFFALPGTRAETDAEREDIREGARRLGAAFQKVNFLRDLAADHNDLGRTYFTGSAPGELTEQRKAELVAEIDADLRASRPAMARLDHRVERAVRLAHDLFEELNRRLEATPAAELSRRRVRVPGPVKARLAARAVGSTTVFRRRKARA